MQHAVSEITLFGGNDHPAGTTNSRRRDQEEDDDPADTILKELYDETYLQDFDVDQEEDGTTTTTTLEDEEHVGLGQMLESLLAPNSLIC